MRIPTIKFATADATTALNALGAAEATCPFFPVFLRFRLVFA
jgi:hypothetical protein